MSYCSLNFFLLLDLLSYLSKSFLLLIAVHVSRLASHTLIFKEGLAGIFPVVLLVFQVFKYVGVEEDLGWLRTEA